MFKTHILCISLSILWEIFTPIKLSFNTNVFSFLHEEQNKARLSSVWLYLKLCIYHSICHWSLLACFGKPHITFDREHLIRDKMEKLDLFLYIFAELYKSRFPAG